MIAKHNPCIVIPGFCQSKLMLTDENGNIEEKVWPAKFDFDMAEKTVIPAYLKTVISRRDCGFTDRINDIFFKALEKASVKDNGEMKYRIQTVKNFASVDKCGKSIRNFTHKIAPVDKLSQEIGDENIYLFSYNFFSSPFAVAKELDEFITFVKTDSGSDKVTLLPYSLGGPITLAYFDLYGEKNDVERVFYLVPAFNGSSIIADIMSNNVDKKQGYSVLEFVFSADVADIFRKVLFFTPWKVRYALLYKSLATAMDTVLRNSPLMWSLVPSERYDELAEKILSDENHATLLEKTEKFHEIQKRSREILKSVKAKGTDVFICAGYGQRLIEISLDGKTSSDRIVELSSSTLGLNAAIGETPNVCGALFPETTYLIKGLNHVTAAENEEVQELVMKVLTGERAVSGQ